MRAQRLVRLSPLHLGLAHVLFALEALIASSITTGFVRTFVGDVLVIPLLHCLLRSALDLPPRTSALCVFLFACAIELGQAMQLVHRLGLQHNTLARIIIGTSYDPLDFVAYAAGAGLVLLAQRALRGPLTAQGRGLS